jgi:NAD(P)-dependent dehydrogenase (short-subunit alcohol dehydrogenase family)
MDRNEPRRTSHTNFFARSQAMWDLIDEELGKKKGAKKGETIQKYTDDLILLGRTSVPNDVASLVSFLSGKDSDYMTGQT